MYKVTLELNREQLTWLDKALTYLTGVIGSDLHIVNLVELISHAKRVCELNDEAARIQSEIHTLQNPSVMARDKTLGHGHKVD